MIDIINLTKKFKQNTVVKSVNMHLQDGEIVGLLGPNGAGKSTTISMISSLLEPTSGDIQLHGKSIMKQPKDLRELLGVVPQEIALYQELSAQENLLFFGRIQKLSKQLLHERVEEILEVIGLKDRRKDLVKTFSGGMKRRLNIGVALLHNPKFIIMDEPTVGIDPQSRNYILETVQRLNREKQITVLYTSHYMEEVEFLCDRIYIMDHGQVIASGTKDEIKQILSAENAVEVKLELPSFEFEQALKASPQIKSVTSQGNVVTIIASKGVNMFDIIIPISEQVHVSFTSIEIKNPTLEDVFLHLTGRVLRN